MPKEKSKRTLCVDDLRHAEYYEMQEIFDDLYKRSSNGEHFTELMEIILRRENVLLAYRNIKTNTGSNTSGVDGLTIKDIGKLAPEDVVEKVRFILVGSKHGYRPKPVRRKDIPKSHDPTQTRPLGIPCIWDRLVQQCIKQVMEPICEAKFSDNSYGFRPQRSVEHAISETYRMMQLSKLHYVIEVDIKGFFDNVNHSKLIRQIWAMGIRDTRLIDKIKRILNAPIRMPDGTTQYPEKGTPQGGIISPLLANIVLNELDQWVDSQWLNNPVVRKYSTGVNQRGNEVLSNGYRAMRTTKLKEMRIVRYADDFRIFCRNQEDANKTKIAVTQWLKERLKLDVSEEKTRIVNVERHYSEFLGFKIKVHSQGGKLVVKSHIGDKQLKKIEQDLIEQAKAIAKHDDGNLETYECRLFNSKVMGIQNYYCLATNVNVDLSKVNRKIMTVLTNRLDSQRGSRLVKEGRKLTESENQRYGKSKMLRYVAGTGEPIYPIGYVKHKNPSGKRKSDNCYTKDGRKRIHDTLRVNVSLMLKLMKQPLFDQSIEYADNRISLFSAQWGKCAVTGKEFMTTEEIHCHHKTPREKGGSDKYENLILVLEPVHKLIHATTQETIDHYKTICNLDKEQLAKLNELRKAAGLAKIS